MASGDQMDLRFWLGKKINNKLSIVTFQSVSVDESLGGRFRIKSERGGLFEGRFKAD